MRGNRARRRGRQRLPKRRPARGGALAAHGPGTFAAGRRDGGDGPRPSGRCVERRACRGSGAERRGRARKDRHPPAGCSRRSCARLVPRGLVVPRHTDHRVVTNRKPGASLPLKLPTAFRPEAKECCWWRGNTNSNQRGHYRRYPRLLSDGTAAQTGAWGLRARHRLCGGSITRRLTPGQDRRGVRILSSVLVVEGPVSQTAAPDIKNQANSAGQAAC